MVFADRPRDGRVYAVLATGAVMSGMTPNPVYVGADQQPLEPGWGRGFLVQCDIDPDDPADVRAAYESSRAAYGLWLWTQKGEIDNEAYYMLVDAIKDLYGWTDLPLHWPAPTLVRMTQPLRNTLRRTKPTETT